MAGRQCAVPINNTPDASEEIPTAPLKQYIEFGVWLTVDEAKALKQFFNANGIEYKKI